MKRVFGLALLGLVLAVPALVGANDDLSGNWVLTSLGAKGATETTKLMFKLETKDGKTTATVVSSDPQMIKPEVSAFSQNADRVRLTVKFTSGKAAKAATQTQIFEGYVAKDGKKIFGVVGQNVPAYMAPTNLKELDPKDITRKLPAEGLKSWAEIATAMAQEHNSPWALDVNSKFANIFLAQKNTELAVLYASAAERALTNKAAARDLQVSVLETLSKALKNANKEEELTTVTERLAALEKMELAVDEEYHATVPSFQGHRFAGRKSGSDRVVLMELFTGAECPPCVAADVAFDVLQKTYRRSELVVLQYHLHIPGPDPMTNADTETRAAYYGAKSTPSTFFNGANKGSGGGAMGAAENKYNAYCKLIDPLLEAPAAFKIIAAAKRVGDKIEIKAGVIGLKSPGKDTKLRMVLVEETIRFVGGNKLRFHHQVVRAMPGTPAGVPVTEQTLLTSAAVDLNDLRATFVDYLDDYAATKRPFPRIARPMAMDNLRVVAFVQDDSTKEILQAVQVEVAQ